MYEEGHELANHTFSHPLRTNVANLMKEIQQTDEVLAGITGYQPTLFRPVEGQYTDAMIDAISKKAIRLLCGLGI